MLIYCCLMAGLASGVSFDLPSPEVSVRHSEFKNEVKVLVGFIGFSRQKVTLYLDDEVIFEGDIQEYVGGNGLSAYVRIPVSGVGCLRVVSGGFDETLNFDVNQGVRSILIYADREPHIIPSQVPGFLLD